ncbi:hypothetical protein [Moraxella lacunata]|uniref:hypothetical protein n=1 Tax=Moraxella lacunata TaxID=477 RepID=UPI0012E9F2D9|nr:hypothetical protein [Moraxella lacunata]
MGILDDKSALTYHKCERLAKCLLGKVGVCADWFFSFFIANTNIQHVPINFYVKNLSGKITTIQRCFP